MARKIVAIVAGSEYTPRDAVSSRLPAGSGINAIELSGSVETLVDEIRQLDGDLLIALCAPNSEENLELVQWWRSVRPGRPALVLRLQPGSTDADQPFMGRAFAYGADDVIVLDFTAAPTEQTRERLAFEIRKAVARTVAAPARPADAGTCIGVLGPKGGTGKTLTSTNLAVALAMRGRRTAIVDIDLQFGDVALSLGLAVDRTLFDLAVSGGGLDTDKLDDFLLRHRSGLRVLAAPVRPDQATSVSSDMLKDVFRLLKSEYDFVIVDTPPYFSSEVIATIDASTDVCMLAMRDALSLKNARLGIQTLDLMGYDNTRIKVVLNRSNSNVGITDEDVVAILGREPDILVPSHRDVVRSVNEGSPVVMSQPQSEMADAFEALASLFTLDGHDAGARRDTRPTDRSTQGDGSRRGFAFPWSRRRSEKSTSVTGG